jgi:hypothetical protein
VKDEPGPMIATVEGIIVLRCMCGGQRCHHCGHIAHGMCSSRVPQCPKCGCPLEMPLNAEEPIR